MLTMALVAMLAGSGDFLSRAKTLEAAGQWEAAHEIYRHAFDTLPAETPHEDRLRLLTVLADVSVRSGDFRRALTWIGKADADVRTDADRAVLLNARGNIALRQGRLGVAENEFRAALELRPPADTGAAALINLASVESQTGRVPQARVHAQEALQLWRRELGDRHPSVAGAWITLSTMEALSGDWRAAERSLRAALDVEQSPDAMWNLAVVLERLGKGGEAARWRKQVGEQVRPAAPTADWRSLGHAGPDRAGIR